MSTVYQRDQLKAHLLKTAERLDYMSLDIQNRWQDGEEIIHIPEDWDEQAALDEILDSRS